MQQLTNFTNMTDKQYTSATSTFTGAKAESNYQLFIDFVANAISRYFEHQDYTHLNKVLEAARTRGVYRDYVSLAKSISGHTWDTSKRSFGGTMDKAKMSAMRETNDDGVLVFEAKLMTLLTSISQRSQDKESSTPKPIDSKAASKRMKALFTTCGKGGLTLEQLDKIYFEVRKGFE
jgi:hypothetical protein